MELSVYENDLLSLNNKRDIKTYISIKNKEILNDIKVFKSNNKGNKYEISKYKAYGYKQLDKLQELKKDNYRRVQHNNFLKFCDFIALKISYKLFRIKSRLVNFNFNYKLARTQGQTMRLSGETFWRTFARKSGQTLFLTIMAVIILLPFFWMILNSFRSSEEMYGNTDAMSFWPETFDIKSYQRIFTFVSGEVGLGRFFENSFLIAFISTITQISLSVIGGFAISNWKTRLTGPLLTFMFATMMIPGEAMLLGQYLTAVNFGLKNNPVALVLPFIANVFTTYLMSQSFSTLNGSVKRAAKIDGLSTFKYFWKVAIPTIRGTIITSALISFISAWNAILWPTMILDSDSDWMTIPMLLKQMMGVHGGEGRWDGTVDPGFEEFPVDPQNLKMSAAVLSILPMVVLLLVANKSIIKGITSRNSGTKG